MRVTNEIFAVVPPMSKAITSSCDTALAEWHAASTPPAGPDSTSRIGALLADDADVTPPFDSMTKRLACNPSSAIDLPMRVRYERMIGRTYALATTVEVRSYSRISG